MKYPTIIERMSLEEKIALCSGADYWSTKALENYRIPSIYVTDGPHGLRKQVDTPDNLGINKSVPSTCFPTASATASSWDRALLEEMGAAMGEEALQEQVSVILGPGVNIKRNPLCGRNFEYFSEDPCLAGEMAVGWINGVQSKGIGVSIKHFAANSQENLRMVSDSIMDERTLREIYLAAFEKAVVGAKPATVMCAYNRLNGIYCSDHSYLLNDILRKEWGFNGVIMTDWGAMNDRVKAFEAGLDLEMPGGMSYFDQTVINAVRTGKLAEERVDEAVDRLLEMIFTGAKNRKSTYRYDVQAHHQLAKRIAASSAVLLKNDDHILPVARDKKIALIGALAEKPRYQGAGSSNINPTRLSSAIDGFDEQGLNYSYYPGYLLKGPSSPALLQDAVMGAKQADVVIVFAGLTDDYESEGFDRSSMDLPESHCELIVRVVEANPNVVVVLSGGAAVTMPWLASVKGVLNLSLAGQAGGLAAAELISGAVNPSGKLAETYPLRYEDVPCAGFYEDGGRQAQYREGIFVGYRYYDRANKDVLFPFGYGLSYTSFEYSDLSLSRTEMQAGDTLDVTVTVKNTGNVDGAEVVQLYVSQLNPVIFRPEKELKDFSKVFLKAGEQKQVTFSLNSRSFAIYDSSAHAWVVPDGTYTIAAAASSRDIRLSAPVKVHGAAVRPGAQTPRWYTDLSGPVTQADFEGLLGRKIEAEKAPQRGDFSMSSTLRDMQSNRIIQMMIQYVEKTIAKNFDKVDYSDPNFKMMMETALNTPMKNLVLVSAGDMPANLARGLVHIANGKFFKGIGAILFKTKSA